MLFKQFQRNFRIVYLITQIPPQIIYFRLLKWIGLKETILRKQFPFNKPTQNLTIDCTIDYNLDYTNEKVKKINNEKIEYFIGDKSKILDFDKHRIDKKDYLFDYLFWYCNWIFDKENLPIFQQIITIQSKIKILPHPVSNRVINMLLQKNKLINQISEGTFNDILKKDFYTLNHDLELETMGNHIIDNLIALLYLEKVFNLNIGKYEDFLKNLLDNNNGYPENNPSYAILIWNKSRALSLKYGEIEIVNNLLLDIREKFLLFEVNKIPFYNDTYFRPKLLYPLNDEIDSLKSSPFYDLIKINEFEIIYIKNTNSKLGFNGHDYDQSNSLYIKIKNTILIGNSGTKNYEQGPERTIRKTRYYSGGAICSNQKVLTFIDNFKVLKLKTTSTSKIEDGKWITYNFLVGDNKGKVIITNREIIITHVQSKKRKRHFFTFYSDYYWEVDNAKARAGGMIVSNYMDFKQTRTSKHLGVYKAKPSYFIEIKYCNNLKFSL